MSVRVREQRYFSIQFRYVAAVRNTLSISEVVVTTHGLILWLRLLEHLIAGNIFNA